MKLEDQSSVRTAAMLALHEAVEYLRGVGYRFVTPTPSTIARVNGRKANPRRVRSGGSVRLEPPL
jgi:hypothetical protein